MCSGARGGVSFLSLEVCEQRRWVRSASVPRAPVAPRARRPLEPRHPRAPLRRSMAGWGPSSSGAQGGHGCGSHFTGENASLRARRTQSTPVCHPEGRKGEFCALGGLGAVQGRPGPNAGPAPSLWLCGQARQPAPAGPQLLLVATRGPRGIRREMSVPRDTRFSRGMGEGPVLPTQEAEAGPVPLAPPKGQKWGEAGGTGGPKAWAVPPIRRGWRRRSWLTDPLPDPSLPLPGLDRQRPRRGWGQVPLLVRMWWVAGGSGATRHLPGPQATFPRHWTAQARHRSPPPLEGRVLGASPRWGPPRSGRGPSAPLVGLGGFLPVNLSGEGPAGVGERLTQLASRLTLPPRPPTRRGQGEGSVWEQEGPAPPARHPGHPVPTLSCSSATLTVTRRGQLPRPQERPWRGRAGAGDADGTRQPWPETAPTHSSYRMATV